MQDNDAFRIMTRATAGRWLCAVAIFSALVLSCPSAKAQPYVGGSIGSAQQRGIGDDHIDRSACRSWVADRQSNVGAVFAGYRWGYIGAEVGTGTLFKTHFHAECGTMSGEQTIQASHRYARINGYIPLGRGLNLVPFIGRAVVRFQNYEEYNAPDLLPPHETAATNWTTGKQISPIRGVGVEKELGGWFLRAEYQRADRVAEDYWTARGWRNTIQTVSVGLGYSFK